MLRYTCICSVFLLSLNFIVTEGLSEDSSLKAKYSFSTSLDENENYWLYWKADLDAGVISFAVQVATAGWIGFGLSPDGGMPNSDIVTAWVKEDKGFLQDRYSTAKALPPKDAIQNVELVASSEANQVTTIEFKRNIKACEAKDRTIEMGSTRVIWAYNPNDPDSENSLQKHTNKGSMTLHLLKGVGSGNTPFPSDVQHFDVTVDQISLFPTPTLYWCKSVSLPKIDGQIIGYEAILKSSGVNLINHIIVYQCTNITNLTAFNSLCGPQPPPPDVVKCLGAVPIAGYAVGSQGVRYPPDVGISFGGSSELQTAVLEIRYENPKLLTRLTDSSGLRFYYTQTKRKYQAALMSVGHFDHSDSLLIAPGKKSVTMTNLCPAECTAKSLPPGGVTVINSLLHGHETVSAMKIRHIRNGVELPEIERNDNYDYLYQEVVPPVKETKILPGDILQVVCTFDTTSRTDFTFGGLMPTEELCLAFIAYYPDAPLELRNCKSEIPRRDLLALAAEANAKNWAPGSGQISDLKHFNLSLPGAQAAYDKYLAIKNRTIGCFGPDDLLLLPRADYLLPEGVQNLPPEPTVEPCNVQSTPTSKVQATPTSKEKKVSSSILVFFSVLFFVFLLL